MASLVFSTTSVDQLDGAQLVGVGDLARVVWVLLFFDAVLRLYRFAGDDRACLFSLCMELLMSLGCRFYLQPWFM